MPLVKYLSKDKDWTEQDLGGVRPHPSVCIVRYGGIGDMIQVSPMFKYFKEKGYYVTVNTKSMGLEIVKNDPHIDEIYVQGNDQVPMENHELAKYWYNMSLLFDRYHNLSEHVEMSLLVTKERLPFTWPQRARHLTRNINYSELLYAICDEPFNKRNANGKFYPTQIEDYKAKRLISRIKKDDPKAKVVLWSLSGSSVHKASPWVDAVIARFMLKSSNTHFILTGDNTCKLLERGWEKEPRVHLRSGSDIRDTLALIPHVDAVIGPETGVLNAAGGETTPSILYCSHSNPNKVSKYWKNHINLEPKGVSCYPCHILFQKDTLGCNMEEETAAAMCAYKIGPDELESALDRQLKFKKKKKRKR